jgi:Cobalamin-independent synthase, Catalytic domain
VMVGVIDVASDTVETPEQVAATIRQALQYVPAERLYPCTNCGMVPMDRSIARRKLAALSAGAAALGKDDEPAVYLTTLASAKLPQAHVIDAACSCWFSSLPSNWSCALSQTGELFGVGSRASLPFPCRGRWQGKYFPCRSGQGI